MLDIRSSYNMKLDFVWLHMEPVGMALGFRKVFASDSDSISGFLVLSLSQLGVLAKRFTI